MDLEDIKVSELSQVEKDKYCMISHIRHIKNKISEYNKKQ